MKRCTKCGVEQDLAQFSKDAKRKDGLQPHCKACFREYKRANRERLRAANRDDYENNTRSYKDRARRWRESNPERKKDLDTAWRRKNAEKKAANDRAWYERNIDRKRAYDAKWRPRWLEENKHLTTAQAARRRARKAKAMPAWADHLAISQIYEDARRRTQETGVAHDVDHIVPLAGDCVCGLHVETNLRVVLASENRSKGNRFDADRYPVPTSAYPETVA